MASHHGIGRRLLDGRQITIMSLVEQGLPGQAITMIDTSVPAEPWEPTVASILRICCRPGALPAPQDELDHAVREALTLAIEPDPLTAAFRTRAGLTALDLTTSQPTQYDTRLQAALATLAASDAYAARDVLSHAAMRSHLTRQQQHELAAIVAAAGLGTGNLPAAHMHTLNGAVNMAEDQLRALLTATRQKYPVC